MPKSKKRVKSKNIAAIIAAIIILLSGFLFQLFNFEFLGREWTLERAVMFNLITELEDLSLPGNLENIIILMVIIYFIIVILYLLNGFSVLSDKFSFIASLLTSLYLFLGVYFVSSFNEQISLPIIGSLVSVSLGLGTYILPIIAAGYLLLKNLINKHISFN